MQNLLTKYGLTVTAVATAAVARWLLDPLLHDNVPYATFFAAVAFAAWLGGLRTGLLATVLGCLIALYLFVPPRFSLPLTSVPHLVGAAVFAAVGITIAAFGEALRLSQSRSEDAEKQARQQAEMLRISFASIGDAVITTDAFGDVTYLNPVAESLTGWTQADARGKPLNVVFNIVNEKTRESVENPAFRALREGIIVGLANHTILIAKNGRERPIDDSASPIRSENGEIIGCVLVFRDIAERHSAERSLRESEERAAFVRQACGIGFWYCNLPFDTLQWDELVKAHFHLPTDAPVTIDTFYALIHSDDREPTRRAIERSIQDRTQYDTEYRTVAPDSGEERWVRAIGRTFYTAEGRPTRFDGVTFDITEQKRAEGRLRASEERLRLIVESATDYAIFTMDTHGVIDGWNTGAAGLFGYSEAEAVGQHERFLYSPEDAAAKIPEREMRKAEADGRAVNERWHMRKNGDRFWGSGLVQPLQDGGGLVGFLKIMRDRTEQRETEERLQQSESRLRRVFESNVVGMIRWDLERSLILDANAEFLRMTGYTRDDVTSGRLNFRDMTPPEWTAQNEYGIRAIRADGFAAPYEKEYFRKDGSRMPLIIAGLRFEDSPSEGMSFIIDISETKRAQAALQDADRRKDEFLATLAHELRNPLAPIRNGLQIIRMANGNTEAIEQARIMMERQLDQMVRLVDDLMDVSRISRGKLELKKERLSLSVVLNSAVETSRPLIDHMGHELTVTLPKQAVIIDADLTRLAQVFSNLLNNAAKYNDRGGHIRLTAERQGSDVIVSVKDSGIGIPADQLSHIFEMFSQVDRSLEKSQGGLGIGLTLVRRLVEMHGGRVEARSAGLGKGSEFTVRLPVVVEASVPPSPRQGENDSPLKSSLRILIVDDNKDSADSLSMMLKVMGNVTRTAYDGEEAVATAGVFQPAVILLDIGLPKLNGYEACRRIREQPGGKEMVIIAQTGWGQDEDRQRTHEAGFDHHMVKPVDPPALMQLLAELSDAARQ